MLSKTRNIRLFSTAKALASSSQSSLDVAPSFQALKSVHYGKSVPLSPEVENELNEIYKEYINDDSHINSKRLLEATEESRAQSKSASATGNIYGNVEFPRVVKSRWNHPYSKQELFLRRQFFAKNNGKLGADLSNIYQPHNDVHNPPSVRDTSISTLLAAGAHLGHSTTRYRPSTQPFVYGVRDGIHIIDLEQTLVYLRRACNVVEGITKKGGLVVFLGTMPGIERALQKAAKRAGAYYVYSRWVPGTLTNATEISPQWDRIEVDMGDNPTNRELSPNLKRTIVKPDVVVVLNPVENRNALRECMQCKVPTIGIIDTDSEPSLVTYPIPANDDSIRSVELILGVLSRAGEKGKNYRREEFSDYKKRLSELKLD